MGAQEGERVGLRVRRTLVLGKEAVGSELVTDANQKTAAASAAAYQPRLFPLRHFHSFVFFWEGGGSLRHRHIPPFPV